MVSIICQALPPPALCLSTSDHSTLPACSPSPHSPRSTLGDPAREPALEPVLEPALEPATEPVLEPSLEGALHVAAQVEIGSKA
jgi:hypothetical protein